MSADCPAEPIDLDCARRGSADTPLDENTRPSSAHFAISGVRAMDVRKSHASVPGQPSAGPAPILVRPFLLKPQWMNGLSERLLVSHYVNNYGGALRRLNAIRARLAKVDWANAPTFEINGLKREELIASGSVILHEIYFDSLGGQGDNPPSGREEPSADLARA